MKTSLLPIERTVSFPERASCWSGPATGPTRPRRPIPSPTTRFCLISWPTGRRTRADPEPLSRCRMAQNSSVLAASNSLAGDYPFPGGALDAVAALFRVRLGRPAVLAGLVPAIHAAPVSTTSPTFGGRPAPPRAKIKQTVRKLHDLGIEWARERVALEWGVFGFVGRRMRPERRPGRPVSARIRPHRLAQAATAAVIASTPRMLRARRKL